MATLLSDYPLLAHNTFGLPARARYAAHLDTLDALPALLDDARVAGLRRLVFGGGSNLLLRGDVDGFVLLNRLRGIRLCGEDADAFYVEAAAGECWHDFVACTLAQGWPGLENLALIPGTVGAAPVQNIGAYGVELASRVHQVHAWDVQCGETVTLAAGACGFGYRDSVFKHAGRDRLIITAVTFRLPRAWQAQTAYGDIVRRLPDPARATPQQVFDAVVAVRSEKLPDWRVLGNAGSFFKNPVVEAAQYARLRAAFPELVAYAQADGRAKLAAGWLIEQCGFKGAVRGRAGVHERQALVLVNRGGASAAELLALADEIIAAVAQRFGVTLEPEPLVV